MEDKEKIKIWKQAESLAKIYKKNKIKFSKYQYILKRRKERGNGDQCPIQPKKE